MGRCNCRQRGDVVVAQHGATLRFAPAGEGRFRDGASGSEFDLAGRAVAGPLLGRRLAPAPALSTRWYGFVQTYPGASIAE
jgi:hypothetical protein